MSDHGNAFSAEIYEMEIATRTLTRLTNDSLWTERPVYSSDGSRIAFACEDANWTGRADIDISQAGVQIWPSPFNLTNNGSLTFDDFPEWVGDNDSKIAYTGNNAIWIINTDGTGAEIIADKSWGASWGPDIQQDLDFDGDGYTISDGDCDDTNPDINPNATEIYGDNIDNNCNGQIDEGCSDTGTPVTLATGLNNPYYIVVGYPYAYVTNMAHAVSGAGSLVKVNLIDGTVTTLVSGLSGPCQIAIDSTDVYFTENNVGNVKKVGSE